MKSLLHRISKEKQEKRYNIFVGLKDVKQVQRNQLECLERIDARLAHIEYHLQCDPTSWAYLGSSAKYFSPLTLTKPQFTESWFELGLNL